MSPASLEDCTLVRTAAGTRKMRDRAEGLAAKLRSVLFLVDGSAASAILARAGALRPILEAQLLELLDLGLIECVRGSGAVAIVRAPRVPAAAESVAALLAAKIELLDALERLGADAMRRSGAITESRSWSELAHRAKEVAIALDPVIGAQAAADFWKRAKAILIARRPS